MIIITARRRQQAENEIHAVVREEIMRQWREASRTAKHMGADFDGESSFDVRVLERAQWAVIRTVGIQIWDDLGRLTKARPNLVKWQTDVQQAMAAHNARYVQAIDEATRAGIVKILQQAVEMHWTPDEIARQLVDKGLVESEWRARRIATTEGTRAASMGTIMAANDFPYQVEKHWIHQDDDRVRKSPYSHRFNAGTGIPFEQAFNNGEDIYYPGDPGASPANTVNCRCMLMIAAKKDDHGNLMPKRRRWSGVQALLGRFGQAVQGVIDRISGFLSGANMFGG